MNRTKGSGGPAVFLLGLALLLSPKLAAAQEPVDVDAQADSGGTAEDRAPETQPAPTESELFAETAAGLAPIGVQGGQTYRSGQFMVMYRYSRSHYEGMRDGTRGRSVDEVLARYPQAPDQMDLETHLFTFLYQPHERIALQLDLPVERAWLEQVRADGSRTREQSTGIGDLRLTALVPFMRKKNETLQFGLTLGMPTGSLTEKDPQLLPYPLQPGAGTFSLEPRVTYRGHKAWASWGFQSGIRFEIGKNSHRYSLGTHYDATAWVAGQPFDWLSGSLRVAWSKTNNVHRGDPGLGPPYSSPIDEGGRQGAMRVDLGPGINFRLPCCGEQRLAVEALWPIYQDLSGPQLARKWNITAGWQWVF